MSLSGARLGYLESHMPDYALEQVPEPPSGRPPCPHCHGSAAYSWGTFAGRSRYRCRQCRKTYTALTATPLARLKYRDRWAGLGWCLLEGRSVRYSAAVLGVHPSTAFRWRHRFLDALRGHLETQLARAGGVARLAFLFPFRRRLADWSYRFHGVSPRYYLNYVAWFAVIRRQEGAKPVAGVLGMLEACFGGTAAQPYLESEGPVFHWLNPERRWSSLRGRRPAGGSPFATPKMVAFNSSREQLTRDGDRRSGTATG